MPTGAAFGKISAVEAFGAQVREGGDSVDRCIAHARDHAGEHGATFVHPFDDLDVIKSQAGVGLELCEQLPVLAKVVVPIGGGGLACGIAIAIKELTARGRDHRRPGEGVGAVRRCTARPAAPDPTGIDDRRRIAIKRPGELRLPVVERLLDDVVTVGDDVIAEAMIFLLKRGKLLTEGAGAAATAALIAGATAPATRGATVAILSGGNVDIGNLASVISRHETVAARRLRLFTHVSDRPGGLAAMLAIVAAAGASVREVSHVREGVELHVGETGIELLLETRGESHARAVTEQLAIAGHHVSILSSTDSRTTETSQ
jgi:threonine dehydratase